MRKFWLSLTGVSMVVSTSLTTISCGTQRLGWSTSQYWMVLNYQDFHDWMHYVALVKQDDWKSKGLPEKQKAWATINNVGLNNFMTIMTLTFNYLKSVENKEQLKPKPIDNLGGLYYNFGAAILKNEDSFAKHLLNLKNKDQPLINQEWKSLEEETFLEFFKANSLDNKFEFKTDEGKFLPVEMSITANDGRTAVDEKILEAWKPIGEAIANPKKNNDLLIKELWRDLKDWHFEAFIFNFHIYWPGETGLRTSFQINLTFDF